MSIGVPVPASASCVSAECLRWCKVAPPEALANNAPAFDTRLGLPVISLPRSPGVFGLVLRLPVVRAEESTDMADMPDVLPRDLAVTPFPQAR